MEFDTGTLIYIILGIIYFVFTGLNRKRKGQQTPDNSPEADNPETVGPPPLQKSFEELLEEFTTGKKTDREPEPFLKKDPVERPASITTFQKKPRAVTNMESDYYQEPKIYDRMIVFEENDDEEVEENPYVEMFRDTDSVKKAFVASEILKRKY